MSLWLWAAAGFLALLLPCGLIAVRGESMDRLLGLQLGGIVATLAFVALAEGFERSVYFDLALVFAVLSFTGNLLFVRLFERWV